MDSITALIARSFSRSLLGLLLLIMMAGPNVSVSGVSNTVAISQVYGGGGNAGAFYKNDFIELYNRGTVPIDLSGWSVQYAAATGSSWQVTVLQGSIAPGRYYLVQQAAGSGGSVDLPAPDGAGSIAMNAASGKVALSMSVTPLSGSCPTIGVVDLVGYGGANCFEGAGPAPTLTNTTAALRAGSGAIDTDHNQHDFIAGPPTPRNAAYAGPAPEVQVLNVRPESIGIDRDADITVAFSQAVVLEPAWYRLECGGAGPIAAVVTGSHAAYTINPVETLPSGADCILTIHADKVRNTLGQWLASNYTVRFTTAGACGQSYTPISTIQGAGNSSPIMGERVIVEAIVTAQLMGSSLPQGVFIQSLPSAEDANSHTSEGLFLKDSGSFAPGTYLRIQALIDEISSSAYGEQVNMTGLVSVNGFEICAVNMPLPPPVEISLPLEAGFEPFEGMLVKFMQPLTVQQNYFLGRFGQVTLAAGGRAFHPLNDDANLVQSSSRMLVLDDGRHHQNPNPLPYYTSDGDFRAGDTLTALTGVLDQGRINSSFSTNPANLGFPNIHYRLHPIAVPVVSRTNPRNPMPPAVGGTIKVASFNVQNYFTTFAKAEFPEGAPYTSSQPPRGADTLEELLRQQKKLVAALAAIDADIVGLIEIEAWDGANAVHELVAALNTSLGENTYAVVPDPLTGTGGDLIQVALIYKPGAVSAVGPSRSTGNNIFNRDPVAQMFEAVSGERFFVVVNHFKSKSGCPANSPGNQDQGDGQGCWNARRVQQAQALLAFINTVLIPQDRDVLVIGDLNAYGLEDPIRVLTEGGLVNQVSARVPAVARYSYIFDGASGYLDHALTTFALGARVTGAAFWHINTDEPAVIDYNLEFKTVSGSGGAPDFFQPHPFRSSDHDPLLIGLDLLLPSLPGANAQVFLPVVASR
jgi:uncharacterized protein